MDAFAQVAGTPLGGSTGPIDMSVYGLFMQADWVVKAVMIALLLASFWSWAMIFEKMLRLRALKRSATLFEDTFWSGVSQALFATAIGLVAAIPAAGAYNILSGQVARYAQQLEAFAGEFITILSRQ